MKNYQLVDRSFQGEVAGYSASPSGLCPEPGCGKKLSVEVNYDELAKFPALMCLEGIIVCNECAEFRHALRDAQSSLAFLAGQYRRFAIPIAAVSKTRHVIQEELEKLNAKMHPAFRVATRALLLVLARRSGRPVIDEVGWASRFIMEQWEEYQNYGGEVFVRLKQDNPVGLICAAIRTQYGIVLKHHGRRPQPKPQPKPQLQPQPQEPEF